MQVGLKNYHGTMAKAITKKTSRKAGCFISRYGEKMFDQDEKRGEKVTGNPFSLGPVGQGLP